MKKQDLIRWAVLIGIFIGVSNFLFTSVSFLTYEYDLDYSEGFIIDNTEELDETGNLYPEINEENDFRSVKYTPLYYFFLLGSSSILGLSFLTGRLISFLSAIGITALIYLISDDYSTIDETIFFLPLIFLVPFLSVFISNTVRPDTLALFFSITGAYLFLKDRMILSPIFFLLAFFTKQSFVAGVAASGLILFYNTREELLEIFKDREISKLPENLQRFTVFSYTYISGILIGLILLYLWQPNIFLNILSANLGGFTIRWELINWAVLTFLPLSIATFYSLYITRNRFLALYLSFSVILMFVQFLRGGAWIHAAAQPLAVSIITISITYRRFRLTRAPLNMLLLIQILIFFSAPIVSGNIFQLETMTDFNEDGDSEIMSYIEKEGDAYSEHVGYELKSGDTTSPEIWGVYELYSSGRLSENETLQYFKKKNYTYILTYKRLWNLPVDIYIEDNYEKIDEIKRKDTRLHVENWGVYRWTG